MRTATPPSDVPDELPEDVAAAWATVLLDIHNKTAGTASTTSTTDTEAQPCDER